MPDNPESVDLPSGRIPDPSEPSTSVDPWLIRLLACPVDLMQVSLEGNELVCHSCGRRYPIRDGVPVMIAASLEK